MSFPADCAGYLEVVLASAERRNSFAAFFWVKRKEDEQPNNYTKRCQIEFLDIQP
jgi:hypothetical protein